MICNLLYIYVLELINVENEYSINILDPLELTAHA